MKEITGKQKTKSNLLPQEIKVDKTIIENPQHIAKEFNKIFYFCWANIGEESPEHWKTFLDFLTFHYEKMHFTELNFDEFEEVFKSLKRNKVAGFDDFKSNAVANGYDSLKNILFHAFKVSIQQGIFPDSPKIAKVTPIFKSGDKDNASNYCLISILSVFSKVLERIMCNTVNNHLDSKGLLYEKQFGF